MTRTKRLCFQGPHSFPSLPLVYCTSTVSLTDMAKYRQCPLLEIGGLLQLIKQFIFFFQKRSGLPNSHTLYCLCAGWEAYAKMKIKYDITLMTLFATVCAMTSQQNLASFGSSRDMLSPSSKSSTKSCSWSCSWKLSSKNENQSSGKLRWNWQQTYNWCHAWATDDHFARLRQRTTLSLRRKRVVIH